MGTHPIFESDFDCLTDIMVCVPCIVIPALLWVYQNYLKKYLDPILGPILGPILKPLYSVIEPYVGKYINPPPKATGEESKCPVTGTSSATAEECPAAESPAEVPPSPARRRVKKAD